MEAIQCPSIVHWKRTAGVTFGCLTQLLFALTVWHLYWFLKDGKAPTPRGSLLWDALLALQFAIPHSILLLPAVKARLSRIVAPAFYGLMFCTTTCASLLLVIHYWQGNETELWNCRGAMYSLMVTGFVMSWLALYYSISITGLGYQTGYTPWSYWLRGQPVPPRGFAVRGAYRFLRHPVYLSFLGLIWFTPRMTLDHALLTVIWTAYIFVGSWLKDRRLTFYIGDKYRSYVAAVPGYPLVPFGPLARRRSNSHSGN